MANCAVLVCMNATSLQRIETAVLIPSSLNHAGCAALFLLLWQCGIIHLSDNLCEELIHHGLALG